MAGKKIQLSDSFSITDEFSVTTSLSPLIYREEFEVHRKASFLNRNDKSLVFAYLFLQLYLENHFHYFLRFLVGGGFRSAKAIHGWNEKDYADEKLEKFRDFLSQNNFVFSRREFTVILDSFRDISAIRNKFAHGHPVTKTVGSGVVEQSVAKDYLNLQKLNDTIGLANQIVNSRNIILGELQSQEKLLQVSGLPSKSFFEDCKLQKL